MPTNFARPRPGRTAVRRLLVALAAATTLAATLGTGAFAQGAGSPPPQANNGVSHQPVCPGPAQSATARCDSDVVTDAQGHPLATSAPNGYGPTDLQSAYNLPSSTAGGGQTVAIVDAYNDPTAVAAV